MHARLPPLSVAPHAWETIEGVDTARIVARLAEAAFGLELRALGEEG
jgi:hypothetical protein